MPSLMPSESAIDKSVDSFGIGTYDYSPVGGNDATNSNKKHTKKSLPSDGGSEAPMPETMLSYPEGPTVTATSLLPSDIDRPTGRGRPGSHYDSVVHSQAESKLLQGREPSAMSAYRDPSVVTGSGDVWADEPGDTFASDTLPGPARNDETTGYLDSHYGPLGGKRIQDQTDSFDPKDYPQGNVVTSSVRVATNHELVRDLVKDFIKDHGKKDITKRHILAFLKAKGSYAFLSSDMIRCMNLEHNAKVMDVLDVFPVKVASVKSTDLDSAAIRIASIREAFVEAVCVPTRNPDTTQEYHRIAADLALALAAYERIFHHG